MQVICGGDIAGPSNGISISKLACLSVEGGKAISHHDQAGMRRFFADRCLQQKQRSRPREQRETFCSNPRFERQGMTFHFF
jgi:hypothetical protein